MSDTPEADAAEVMILHSESDTWVSADFARKLERERDEWRKACFELTKLSTDSRKELQAHIDALRLDSQKEAEHHDKMVGELERLYDQRDELQKKYDTLATENMLEVHKLCKERDEAIEKLEDYTASSIHTCHDQCKRPMCVLRRERDEARDDAQNYYLKVVELKQKLKEYDQLKS